MILRLVDRIFARYLIWRGWVVFKSGEEFQNYVSRNFQVNDQPKIKEFNIKKVKEPTKTIIHRQVIVRDKPIISYKTEVVNPDNIQLSPVIHQRPHMHRCHKGHIFSCKRISGCGLENGESVKEHCPECQEEIKDAIS